MQLDDQEHQELVQSFVEEARELIDEAEPLIIDLESMSAGGGSADMDTLNTVFRLFHSLKGGAGFLDLPLVSRVTHQAETLLDLFRKGKAHIEPDHVDLITESCDFLRELLDLISTKFTDAGREADADRISKELLEAIERLESGAETAAPPPEPEPVVDLGPPPDEPASDPQPAETDSAASGDLSEFLTPEVIAQFTTEASEQLQAAEDALIDLEKNPQNEASVQEAFRQLHSFKGNCGFMGLSDMQELSMGAETILDRIRQGELQVSTTIVGLLLEILDFLQGGLKDLEKGGGGVIPATSGLLHLLQDTAGSPLFQDAQPKKPAVTPPPAEEAADTSASETKEASPKEATAPPATDGKAGSPAKDSGAAGAGMRQSVRVDVEKMDRLLDLVGELVIAEAMVVQNPDLQDLDHDLDRFERAVMQLNKITRDLQDISTAIRMIPLAGTFRRMHRLVRDVAKKAGKKVELVLEGEGTEVDKTVIEQITDPLVHLLRNSIDHGIETPKAREAAGKKPTGTVHIRAYYVGSEVWIGIRDDGGGLSRDKILAKAVDRGLVNPDDAKLMPDEDVWQLIFQPGFSTAAKVTDVSGRGVGMDVVKRNLEAIRGKVEVESEPGTGTEVTLRIPLTLAIIDGMLLRVGRQRYVLPIVTIRESLQVSKNMITRPMKGREVIRVREHLIPVIRLHELFHIDGATTELQDGIVTILDVDGQAFGLFVDELLGQDQIVIKGLSSYISNHPCISGCTIMGDGGICLILDVGGIVKLAGSAAKAIREVESQ